MRHRHNDIHLWGFARDTCGGLRDRTLPIITVYNNTLKMRHTRSVAHFKSAAL
ncbi:MAG: hypothetical protein QGF90_07720 [Gammaproteobacteria bacterium]|nr:hypothetical protein [Gammaproteobacteria bacterium]